MLAVYNTNKGKDWFEGIYAEKIQEIIYPQNDNYLEIIRDIMLNYIKNGNFDVEYVIDDIRCINSAITEFLAGEAIDSGVVIGNWNTDDDYFEFLIETSDDMLDTLFLGQDIMISIQEMIYEAAKKYNIPLLMKKGMFFEYPEILEMYCPKAQVINLLPDTQESRIHSNHAQLVMFDELLDNEPSFYGRNNILIYDEKGTKADVNLLEG